MGEERLRILQMVAEGKVSPEEASGLLDAVEPGERRGSAGGQGQVYVGSAAQAPFDGEGRMVVALAGPRGGSRLRLTLNDRLGNAMKLVWPLGKARALAGMLPEWARELLQECGIDVGVLAEDPAQFADASGQLFTVHRAEGDEVEIRLE